MNRNSFKQRASGCTPASRFNGSSFQVFLEGRRKAVGRRMPKRTVSFRPENIREIRLAQLGRRLDQRVQHRLQVERRAADYLKHVSSGCLLLQRLAQLVEQSRVLNGNDGLGGEVRNQRNLLVGEGANLLVVDVEETHDLISFLDHWYGKEGSCSGVFRRWVVLGIDILPDIRDVDHIMRPHSPLHRGAGPHLGSTSPNNIPLQLFGDVMKRAGYKLITLSTSAVAVCCCRDSRSSLSSRVFSMAITAWRAKLVTKSICFCAKGRTSWR